MSGGWGARVHWAIKPASLWVSVSSVDHLPSVAPSLSLAMLWPDYIYAVLHPHILLILLALVQNTFYLRGHHMSSLIHPTVKYWKYFCWGLQQKPLVYSSPMVNTGKWETEEKKGQPGWNQGGELSDLKAQPLAEEAPFIWLLEGDREEGLYGKPGTE